MFLAKTTNVSLNTPSSFMISLVSCLDTTKQTTPPTSLDCSNDNADY